MTLKLNDPTQLVDDTIRAAQDFVSTGLGKGLIGLGFAGVSIYVGAKVLENFDSVERIMDKVVGATGISGLDDIADLGEAALVVLSPMLGPDKLAGAKKAVDMTQAGTAVLKQIMKALKSKRGY